MDGSSRLSYAILDSIMELLNVKMIKLKPLGDGLHGRSKLVEVVSLNKVQPVLSQICDYGSVSVN